MTNKNCSRNEIKKSPAYLIALKNSMIGLHTYISSGTTYVFSGT